MTLFIHIYICVCICYTYIWLLLVKGREFSVGTDNVGPGNLIGAISVWTGYQSMSNIFIISLKFHQLS